MKPQAMKRYTADFDIGGTFTDGFFTDGSVAHRAKVFTTPHDLTECFIGCLRLGADSFGEELRSFLANTQVVRLSTTLGTNTLIQRRGPKVGLIVTRGAEQSLYRNGQQPAVFSSIADPALIRGIDEQMGDDGQAVEAPSPGSVLTAVRELIDLGARIIAVSLRNSWRNPAHERRVKEIVLERYPVHYLRSVPLQLAHEIVSNDDDHVRANTVLLNAYLHRDLSRGLYKAEDLARESGMRHPLLVVHAAGGSARVAKTVAVQTLSSGPAVAVRGASIIAKQLKHDHVVCADMGGTSLDVAVLGKSQANVVELPQIHGIEISVPVISTESIGAGGGSIARASQGLLTVGPDSAGSVPGPVCYAKGGANPTVTDANLVLGLLDPSDFLGGKMRLDFDRARDVLARRIGDPLGVDAATAASMIRDSVNASMAKEIASRIRGTGASPSEYVFFAFGGGGPLHACDIAERVGIPKVVGFPFGSVFSAFGSSTADVWHRYSRSVAKTLKGGTLSQDLTIQAGDLQAQGRLDMAGEGFEVSELSESFQLVIADSSGRRTVTFASPSEVAGIIESLEAANPGLGLLEIVFDVRAEMPSWLPSAQPVSSSEAKPAKTRLVRWSTDEDARETPVAKLEDLARGAEAEGPWVIEAKDTVYAVKSGWTARIDGFGNIVIELTSSKGGGSGER